jgi:hypothetical protein
MSVNPTADQSQTARHCGWSSGWKRDIALLCYASSQRVAHIFAYVPPTSKLRSLTIHVVPFPHSLEAPSIPDESRYVTFHTAGAWRPAARRLTTLHSGLLMQSDSAVPLRWIVRRPRDSPPSPPLAPDRVRMTMTAAAAECGSRP